MALIPELKEYLSKVKPEAKSLLTKAAKKMSKAQQRQFLASHQTSDSEFQTAIAPYMPKGSTIDPFRARLIAFPEEAGVGPGGLSLLAASTQGNTKPVRKRYEGIDGNMYEVFFEPDTVTALEARNANPRIYAHEYRHFEGLDGPEAGTEEDREITNRIQDLMASQNLKELKANTRSLAASMKSMDEGVYIKQGRGEEVNPAKRYSDFYNATFTSNEEEIIEAAKGLMRSPQVVDFMDMSQKSVWNRIFGEEEPHVDVRREGALGHYFKRNVLGNTDATEMPEDFRKGGRVRLI